MNVLLKEYFKTIILEKKLVTMTTAKVFRKESGGIFLLLKFSQMLWKIFLKTRDVEKYKHGENERNI